MPALQVKLSRREWEKQVAAEAVRYLVLRWVPARLGQGRWESFEAASLPAAARLVKRLGTDEQGRPPLIYGVLASGYVVTVART